jgi:serine phosphatase RsbU (regulator of sigma subunit)
MLALLVGLRVMNPALLDTVRLRGFDLEQRIAPRPYQPVAVRIVAIDEKSLAKFGQWPWPRTLVAKLVRQIAAGSPRVLGVDIVFPERDRVSPGRLIDAIPNLPASVANQLAAMPANEVALADAFRMVPTVLGVGASDDAAPVAAGTYSRFTSIRESGGDPRPFLSRYPPMVSSLPELGAAERGRGSLIGRPDSDGIVRRVPLFVIADGNLMPTLALEMIRVASGATSIEIVTARDGVRGAMVADLFMPTDARGRAYPYFTPSYEARYVSAADLIDDNFDATKFRGGAVFLGVTALGLVDERQTPLGLMAGVEVQAQLFGSMLTGNLLRRPPVLDEIEIALIVLAGVLTIFALPYRRPRIAIGVVVGLVALMVGCEFLSFRIFKLLFSSVYPAFSTIVVFGVMLGSNLRAAEAARRRVSFELDSERQVEALLDGELRAARAIQMGLLPRRFPDPAENLGAEIYAFIAPARMVGGDLYDFLFLDSRRLSFAIADVAGKGVPAAILMAMTREVLRAATVRFGEALDQVFAEANSKISAASSDLAADGGDMMFVTAFAGVLDLESGLLFYTNAGHDSPFAISAGAEPAQLTGTGGPPLGSVDDFRYPVERRQLAPDEMLFLFTDGVTEAQNGAHLFYGDARLKKVLASQPPRTCKEAIDLVVEDVRRFVAGAEQADDITLLAVRWLGEQTPGAESD